MKFALHCLIPALLVWSLYPKFSNMKSEYGTASVIRDIEQFLRANEGCWPERAEDPGVSGHGVAYTELRPVYLDGGRVFIDFSIRSEHCWRHRSV